MARWTSRVEIAVVANADRGNEPIDQRHEFTPAQARKIQCRGTLQLDAYCATVRAGGNLLSRR